MISAQDVDTIYGVPLAFHEQGLDELIVAQLGFGEIASQSDLSNWRQLVATVREPAPLYFGGQPDASAVPEVPHPEPAATASSPEPIPAQSPEPVESEAANQPRRTGWWSRRFAGDKG